MGDFREGGQGLEFGGCAEGSERGKGKRPLGYLGETEKEMKWTKKSHFSSPVIVMSIPERL